jgi:hypothetical protein
VRGGDTEALPGSELRRVAAGDYTVDRRLKATDLAAKRRKVNRSALIRQALQEHLQRLHVLDLEERDQRGYQARPQRVEEYVPWEETAAWPQVLSVEGASRLAAF